MHREIPNFFPPSQFSPSRVQRGADTTEVYHRFAPRLPIRFSRSSIRKPFYLRTLCVLRNHRSNLRERRPRRYIFCRTTRIEYPRTLTFRIRGRIVRDYLLIVRCSYLFSFSCADFLRKLFEQFRQVLSAPPLQRAGELRERVQPGFDLFLVHERHADRCL